MKKDYILGLDLGTNSIGWACIDDRENKILDTGVRIFDAAEEPKTGASLALPRREAQLTRRRLKRRRERLNKTIKLLIKYKFIKDKKEVQNAYKNNIWVLRVEALDKLLQNEDLAKIIYHIIKNRGFKSSKKEIKNKENLIKPNKIIDKVENKIGDSKSREEEKANKAMYEVEKNFCESGYRTIAEYMLKEYGKNNKNIRNKFGNYNNLIKQDLNEDELNVILDKQKELGNSLIEYEFKQELIAILIYRKGFPSFEGDVGKCKLEPPHLHAPKDAISALLFRAWQNLNNFIYTREGYAKPQQISLEDREDLIKKAFEQKTVTDKNIAKFLSIATVKIDKLDKDGNIVKDKEGNKVENEKYDANFDLKDIAKLLTFKSYHELKEELTKIGVWEKVKDDHKTLDAIVYVVAYLKEHKNLKVGNDFNIKDLTIKNIIEELNFTDEVWKYLFESLSYSKATSHSLNAMWKMLPHFKESDDKKPLTYDKVLNKEYPDRFNSRVTKNKKYLPKFNDEAITNPVVKRAVNQTRLLINKLISEYGKPSQINIELARELGKSFEDRKAIKKLNDENRISNENNKRICEELGIKDTLIYRLWKEQGEQCIYSGKIISQTDLINNSVEIDHILPISRTGDNSLRNKVLVLSEYNQNKGDKIAYEYIVSIGEKALEEYKTRVNKLPYKLKARKEILLLESLDDRKSQEYKTRHLNDTRYISKLLKKYIDENIRPEGQDYGYVETLSGSVTSILRKLWSMGDKNRALNNKHHAMDAILIAAAGEKIKAWEHGITFGARYRYDKDKGSKFSERVQKNLDRFGIDIPLPWESFSKDARYYVENDVFVSRMGKRKVNGAMHKDTIMSKRFIKDGESIVVKKIKLELIDKLKFNEEGITDVLNKMIDIHKDVKIKDFEGRNAFLYKLIIEHAKKHNWKMDEAFNSENAPSMTINKNKKRKHNIPIDELYKNKIRSIKIIARASSSFVLKKMSSEKRQAAVDSGDVIRLDLFKTSKGYYAEAIYSYHYNCSLEELPSPPKEACGEFQFSIYKNDYLLFESDKGFIFEGNNYNTMQGYYNTASSIQIILFPDYANIRTVIGISKISNVKKYYVDILGKKHLVKTPEQRLTLKEVEKKWRK